MLGATWVTHFRPPMNMYQIVTNEGNDEYEVLTSALSTLLGTVACSHLVNSFSYPYEHAFENVTHE